MNAASSAPDEGQQTEQTAPVGADPGPGLPGSQARAHPVAPPAPPVKLPAGRARPGADGPGSGHNENKPNSAENTAASAGQGFGLAAEPKPQARLLEDDELQRIIIRWKEIQADFVDEPRTAVERADALVAGLMQQLTAMLARERAELEQRWAGSSEVSTEELRQSMRRYRSFFERLLGT
jgi:hypothetical protein